MEILLVAATRQEIAGFMAENPLFDHLITGVGTPATIYQLQKQLSAKRYELVIQAGIAGAYSADFGLGTVTLVRQDTFADLGMVEQQQFTSIFDSGFTDGNAFPYSNGWLINNADWITTLGLPMAVGVTVNKVSDDAIQRKQVLDRFAPGVESMEGAAFHFVCLLQKAPFLQVRSISNLVGVRNKEKWDLKGAIQNLNETLLQIIRDSMNAMQRELPIHPTSGVRTTKI